MSRFGHDLTNALRQLAKRPALSGLIAVILALGIGANTAIFTLADAALFRGLPVAEPERVVRVFTASDRSRTEFSNASLPQFRDLQSQLTAFESLAAFTDVGAHVSIDGGMAERHVGNVVTGEYFTLLGIRPHLGRLLAEEDVGQARSVAVVSHHYWRTRLNASDDAIGRSVRINSHPFTVVGVAPPGFGGVNLDSQVDLWMPVTLAPVMLAAFMTDERMDQYSVSWLDMVGRLAPGATLAGARAEADARALSRLEALGRESGLPEGNGPWLRLVPAREAAVDAYATQSTERNAWLLTAIVVLVLALACANVAGLLSVRGEEREREIAVRQGLGASRGRILRMLLTECALLALAGAAAGLLVAQALLSWVATEAPRGVILPVDPGSAILDSRVLAAALIFTGATVLLAGVAPALRGARTGIAATLKGTAGHATASGARTGWRSALVIVQVGITMVLLAGAGLMLRSFWNTAAVDPGFRPGGVALAQVDLNRHGVSAEDRPAMFERVERRVAALPGVTDIAWALLVPVNQGGMRSTIEVDNPAAPQGREANVDLNVVTAAYFETLGIPLLQGRTFGEFERPEGGATAVVNRALAERFWPGENPVGKRILNMPRGADGATVIGVVGNNKQRSLREPDRPILYFTPASIPMGSMTLIARSERSVETLLPAMRRAIVEVDPLLPVTLRTLDDQLGASYGEARLFAWLLAGFASLSLLLAAAGLYGVLAYSLRARTREIGIRMALGATRQRVAALVLKHTGRLVATGMVLGLVCAVGAARLVEGMLFGVAPRDPMTVAGVIVLVCLVALLATWLPLRRAVGVDPARALRDE